MEKITLTIKDDSKLGLFLKLMKQLDFVEVSLPSRVSRRGLCVIEAPKQTFMQKAKTTSQQSLSKNAAQTKWKSPGLNPGLFH